MLWRFRRSGLRTAVFNYSVLLESFSGITARLRARLEAFPQHEKLVLVGHSLGGILLRAALASRPTLSSPPHHLFLLGSPVIPSRVAHRLGGNVLFKAITRDCGQLLGSHARISAIAPATIKTTAIIGIRGITGKHSVFGDEQNDGIVSVSEVTADWIEERVFVPVIHTLLPCSGDVATAIIERVHNSIAEDASVS